MITSPRVLKEKTADGLPSFKSEVQAICENGPHEMLKYAKRFSLSSDKKIIKIPNVGVQLTCDFLKEIGFKDYVKIDVHMLEQIPALLNNDNASSYYNLLSENGFTIKAEEDGQRYVKEDTNYSRLLFILSQQISAQLDMTPFQLDKILYVWGWAKKRRLI